MSRGPGVVQRRLMAILEGEPTRWFTVEELVPLVYPGKTIGPSQLNTVRNSLLGLDVARNRHGYDQGKNGWRLHVRARGEAAEMPAEIAQFVKEYAARSK